MTDFSSLTGRFRLRKDNNGESSLRVTKRSRESFVCNQCRRAKLRCDRQHPCGTCRDRDTTSACSYQRSTGVNGSGNLTAEDRLAHLEALVKELMHNQDTNESTPSKSTSSSQPTGESSLLLGEARTKGTDKARYLGSTHWSAVLDDIQGLKAVLGAQASVPETDRPVLSEVPGLGKEIVFGSAYNASVEEIILQHLPQKVEVDRLLATYLQGENFILPCVHMYQFQRQYREFWANPTGANPLWLSLLFSICCLASFIRDADRLFQSRKITSSDSALFHTAAGKCLVVGEYYRPQQYTIEALTLYAHSKNLQTLDPSREVGAIVGMIIRIAYEMGYHRDPDSLGTFTVFEGEMRRRLWALCKQMDLMISFQLGLPSNICLENCDTRSPSNLLDSDFDTDTQVLPPSRPLGEVTRLLWFIVKDGQMPSFSMVCKDALSFKEKSDSDILELDKEIREMYATTPDVLVTRPLAESLGDQPFIIMTRIFIEFIYQKSLCVLHRKYMTRGSLASTRCCVESGKRIVTQFLEMYKEFAPGGQLHADRWMLSNFIMNDFLLGVVVLCLVIHINRKNGPQGSVVNSATEVEIVSRLRQAHVVCMEMSTASRDARRVSRVILAILNGAPSPQATRIASASDLQSQNGYAQDANIFPFPPLQENGYADEYSLSLGPLDPFNFMAGEFENTDWMMFDPSLINQDLANGGC